MVRLKASSRLNVWIIFGDRFYTKSTTLPPITHPDIDNAEALNIISKGLVEAVFFNKPLTTSFGF